MNVCECLYLTSFMVNPFQKDQWIFPGTSIFKRNSRELFKGCHGQFTEKYNNPNLYSFFATGDKHFSKYFSNHHPSIMSCAIIFVANISLYLHNIFFVCYLFCDIFPTPSIEYFLRDMRTIFNGDVDIKKNRVIEIERLFLLPVISHFEDK